MFDDPAYYTRVKGEQTLAALMIRDMSVLLKRGWSCHGDDPDEVAERISERQRQADLIVHLAKSGMGREQIRARVNCSHNLLRQTLRAHGLVDAAKRAGQRAEQAVKDAPKSKSRARVAAPAGKRAQRPRRHGRGRAAQ